MEVMNGSPLSICKIFSLHEKERSGSLATISHHSLPPDPGNLVSTSCLYVPIWDISCAWNHSMCVVLYLSGLFYIAIFKFFHVCCDKSIRTLVYDCSVVQLQFKLFLHSTFFACYEQCYCEHLCRGREGGARGTGQAPAFEPQHSF